MMCSRIVFFVTACAIPLCFLPLGCNQSHAPREQAKKSESDQRNEALVITPADEEVAPSTPSRYSGSPMAEGAVHCEPVFSGDDLRKPQPPAPISDSAETQGRMRQLADALKSSYPSHPPDYRSLMPIENSSNTAESKILDANGAIVSWERYPTISLESIGEILSATDSRFPGEPIDGRSFGIVPSTDSSKNDYGSITVLPETAKVLGNLKYSSPGRKFQTQKFPDPSENKGALQCYQESVLFPILEANESVASKGTLSLQYGSTLEHALTRLKAKASFLGFSVSADVASENNSERTNLVLLFKQEMFKVIVDRPEIDPAKVIALTDDSFMALQNELKERAPAYISSVSYGKGALLVFSLSGSANEAMASITAAYNGLAGNAEGSITDEQKRSMQEATAQLFIWGCRPETSKAIGEKLSKPSSGAGPHSFLGDSFTVLKAATGYFLPDASPEHAQPIGFTASRLIDGSPCAIISAAPGVVTQTKKLKLEYAFQPLILALNDDGGTFDYGDGNWFFGAAQIHDPNRGGQSDTDGLVPRKSADNTEPQTPSELRQALGTVSNTSGSRMRLVDDTKSDPDIDGKCQPFHSFPVSGLENFGALAELIKRRSCRLWYGGGNYPPSFFESTAVVPNFWVLNGDSDIGSDNASLLITHFLGKPDGKSASEFFSRFKERASWLEKQRISLVEILSRGKDVSWEPNAPPKTGREMLFYSIGHKDNMCVYSIRVKVPAQLKRAPPKGETAETGEARTGGDPIPAKLTGPSEEIPQ